MSYSARLGTRAWFHRPPGLNLASIYQYLGHANLDRAGVAVFFPWREIPYHTIPYQGMSRLWLMYIPVGGWTCSEWTKSRGGLLNSWAGFLFELVLPVLPGPAEEDAGTQPFLPFVWVGLILPGLGWLWFLLCRFI